MFPQSITTTGTRSYYPLNEMDTNQFPPQQTLDASAPPPETQPSHLQTQTIDPCAPPSETQLSHLQTGP
jgi:hypothetical protein